MKYQFAICDDETAQAEYLSSLVTKWASMTDNTAVISVFKDAGSFLFDYEEHKAFDILLLDIEMNGDDPEKPGMNGVGLARRVRAGNDSAQIVFVTGFPDYISEGYEVSALHYLMKPVRESKLFEVLDRAAQRLRSAPRYILLNKPDGSLRIPADDITYAEVFSHTVTLHLLSGTESVNMRIADLEKLLGGGFFRCHRSYIVSMKHVRQVTRAAMVLDGGGEIPLSRKLYDEANQAFIRYN